MIPLRFCSHGSHFGSSIIARLPFMRHISALFTVTVLASSWGLTPGPACAGSPEWNPVRSHPVQIGPQASRLVVGFRATPGNSVTQEIKPRAKAQATRVIQAQTTEADVAALSQRSGIAWASSRQLTPSMHVLFLQKTLYGADIDAALAKLRDDPSVAFADVDERRYPHAMPNDPLFVPTPPTASGQWYMQKPSTTTPTSDAAATDAVSAWDITTGSSGTVIADVDSGIRFDHPDLLRAGFDSSRAGFGGRLLPGYDFVSEDLNRTTGAPLGTFLIANDGDGYDPDPSDPGDWVSDTDFKNALFPATQCGNPNNNNGPVNSSWHGTRVIGVLGAVTNNNIGIAGMTWKPYLLPVRALGKCGGFDSDIIVGIEWAVGMNINGVPDNPYPADIINLSLGGSGGACPMSYQTLITQLTNMGVLVVASAGNESGPVDIPAICPGVLAVAGLRNVGTKVGYSSLGPEVGIGAPAGNCVNTNGGPCLRSIDTTVNEGATVPGANSYTDQSNSNLGTSFSAPIVAGIAALMRSVNANLTPPQLIARIKASATPYPQPVTTPPTPQCVNGSTSQVECACTTTAPTTCGAGMVNALSAVKAALNPIAAVKMPTGFTSGSGTFDGGGSAAACGATISSYSWTSTPAIHIVSGGGSSAVDVMATGAGTLTLVVTDSSGNKDTAIVTFTATGASTPAPSSAGASACIADMTVTPVAPTIDGAFSPASVAANAPATLVLTFTNSNGFALTQSGITVSLPAGLTLGSQAPASTCGGAALALTNTTSSVTLAAANIPSSGSCDISFSVNSATAGTYVTSIASNDLMTGPAGANTAPASATLTVTAATSSPTGVAGSGGGGALDWTDILLVAGVLLVARGHAAKRLARARVDSARPRRRR
jgi:serine protease